MSNTLSPNFILVFLFSFLSLLIRVKVLERLPVCFRNGYVIQTLVCKGFSSKPFNHVWFLPNPLQLVFGFPYLFSKHMGP